MWQKLNDDDDDDDDDEKRKEKNGEYEDTTSELLGYRHNKTWLGKTGKRKLKHKDFTYIVFCINDKIKDKTCHLGFLTCQNIFRLILVLTPLTPFQGQGRRNV